MTGIFVGLAGDEPKAVAIGFLPHNHLWLAPTVGLAYAEKAPAPLVRLVGARMRDWFRRAGHDGVIVINMLHTDRSYMRGLAHFGVPTRVGSVIRFSW